MQSSSISNNILTSSNKSIQDLKNALDRATKIICSTTPSNVSNNMNNIQEYENLHKAKYDKEKIEVIENGISDNENFLGNRFPVTPENEILDHDEIFNQAFINNKTLGSAITRSSSESGISTREQQSKNSQETNKNKIVFPNKRIFSQEKIDFKSNEKKYTNTNAISKNIGINNELRRRSLPARLNNLDIMFSPTTRIKVSYHSEFYAQIIMI